jgi:hypothetical protein
VGPEVKLELVGEGGGWVAFERGYRVDVDYGTGLAAAVAHSMPSSSASA